MNESLDDIPEKFQNAYIEGLYQIRNRGWIFADMRDRLTKMHSHAWFWDWVDSESNGAREYNRELFHELKPTVKPRNKRYKKPGIPYYSESFHSIRRY